MKYYIYSIPKAGTYLSAAILESAGLHNTGWHIMLHHFLDTGGADLSTNTATPTRTKVRNNYVNRFRALSENQFCFGHLSPVSLPIAIARDTAVLRCYRHPRAVLESEFVDFRFRRSDVGPYSASANSDDSAAFLDYLQRRGRKIRDAYIEFLLYEKLLATPEYKQLVGHDRQASVDLKLLRDRENGHAVSCKLLHKLGVERQFTREDYDRALATNTKTKASDDMVNRESLWTEEAERALHSLELEQLYDDILQRSNS